MAKGEISKEFIVKTSVPIFNTKRYTGTSLQDVTRETRFTKGGIYRHFSKKSFRNNIWPLLPNAMEGDAQASPVQPTNQVN